MEQPILILAAFVIGAVFGAMAVALTRGFFANRQIKAAQKRAERIEAEAKVEAKNIINEANLDGDKIRARAESEIRERRTELQRQENRLNQKEANLDNKVEELEQKEHNLNTKARQLEDTEEDLEEQRSNINKRLEEVSGMTIDEAKAELLTNVDAELGAEKTRRIRDFNVTLTEEAEQRARDILAQVIQRNASEVVTETTSSVVPLPSDDMKGRLIGREGRNIRALEQATGVDLIIDDTPEAVTVSSFDPIRREVAKQALNKLILDGRIHPSRIEEIVEKAKEEVEATIYSAGEQAAYQVGVHGLHPELIKLLGKLKYRTSYGQNVLAHSMEVATVAGMIASELHANVAIAKKAGLLHDIGKAVDREVEGTHAAIGADLVKQWDKSKDVVRGVAEHHLDVADISFWGFIVSAADAISSARPGARRESMENYLARIKSLEEIANSFIGVDKSYAIQAGREVRILVNAEQIDDLDSMRLARDIVKKIEETLEYPGQIKVTVVRETRATDYAK
jgi:ribonuclease Y